MVLCSSGQTVAKFLTRIKSKTKCLRRAPNTLLLTYVLFLQYHGGQPNQMFSLTIHDALLTKTIGRRDFYCSYPSFFLMNIKFKKKIVVTS